MRIQIITSIEMLDEMLDEMLEEMLEEMLDEMLDEMLGHLNTSPNICKICWVKCLVKSWIV